MMKILNLYAGIGGNRKLWGDEHEITAVEIDNDIADVYKGYFPDDKVIVTDAHQYLLAHYKEFDFIWASPPCTTHTRMNKNFAKTKNGVGQINPRYADMELYQEIIFLDNFFDGKYCVENVIPYYKPLIPAQQRHRHLYWCNFIIRTTGKKNPEKEITLHTNSSIRKKINSFIKVDSVKDLSEMYGFAPIDKNIYIGKNHSPGQLFRNCVNPKEGLFILECAMNIITKENVNQIELF